MLSTPRTPPATATEPTARLVPRLIIPTLAILIFAALAACSAKLPDVSPFADATRQLRQDVRRSFDASASAYRTLAQAVNDLRPPPAQQPPEPGNDPTEAPAPDHSLTTDQFIAALEAAARPDLAHLAPDYQRLLAIATDAAVAYERRRTAASALDRVTQRLEDASEDPTINLDNLGPILAVADPFDELAIELRTRAELIERRAASHLDALAAMQAYANQLTFLVEQTQQENRRINQYKQAVGSLATQLGAAFPPAAAATPALNTTIATFNEYAATLNNIRTLRNLEQAIAETSEPIQQLTAALSDDIQDLRLRTTAVSNAYNAVHRRSHAGFIEIRERIDREARQRAARTAADTSADDDAWLQQLSELQTTLSTLRSRRSEVDHWLEPIEQQRAATIHGVHKAAQLIDSTADALAAWGRAHNALDASVRAGLDFDPAVLADAAERIRQRIDDVREWRHSLNQPAP